MAKETLSNNNDDPIISIYEIIVYIATLIMSFPCASTLYNDTCFSKSNAKNNGGSKLKKKACSTWRKINFNF